MTRAYLRGLLRPHSEDSLELLRESHILEALQYEERARSLTPFTMVTATVISGARLKQDSRERLLADLMSKLELAEAMEELDYEALDAVSSSLAASEIYGLLKGVGLIGEHEHGQ